ncbi:tripartite tricarboxylate transporter substrate binding protein [Diaphorobacter sp. HDW4B]|uniref:Bug family tripartite tricarboxylate transporter substrate binding protein n=1 Tax=Diaphorobacter sp. HDW4B TaxID=2714925 RepID=UPI001409C1DF|nr:tripartite tricarboxylate transporter substrate binding protein [Diaphorobacter sp. HDW4B]QIL69616.1 tripartite tricarboxylate transporter substrate binding protein [Diaphorobacter sp. HDW4B]
MDCSRHHFLKLVASAGVLALASLAGTSALAQGDYPQKPIKLVVPFAAGGATDILGRLMATTMGEKLGQSVIVENKPGAGTMVAAAQVAKSVPDGYTLLLGSNSTLTLNAAIRQSLPYEPIKSFTMLGSVANMGLVVAVNPQSGVNTLAELVAKGKDKNSGLSYASFGSGSSAHFGAELLQSALGTHMTHVPFNGSSQSLTAVMGGQVPVGVDSVVAAAPQLRSGKLKPLAVLSAAREPLMPDVPTVAESGYPGFQAEAWFALLGPAGLPPAIQTKLENALKSTMSEPEVQKRLKEVGLTPQWSTGKALLARVEQEQPQMRAVAARASIKAD